MRFAWLLILLSFATVSLAQEKIPAGTVLPLRLDTGLRADRARPGQEIRATVMQNIPGTTIRRGTRVLGHVVSITPSRMELRFDQIVVKGRRIGVKTDLRAMASMMDVEEAKLPESGPDRALPPEDWTTEQVGGEQVYRGGGPVTRGEATVARPAPYGIVGTVNSNGRCRGTVAGNASPQALWVFSTDACGVYGYDGVTIEHAGRTEPVGDITLTAARGKLNLRSGSGLLLRVQSAL